MRDTVILLEEWKIVVSFLTKSQFIIVSNVVVSIVFLVVIFIVCVIIVLHFLRILFCDVDNLLECVLTLRTNTAQFLFRNVGFLHQHPFGFVVFNQKRQKLRGRDGHLFWHFGQGSSGVDMWNDNLLILFNKLLVLPQNGSKYLNNLGETQINVPVRGACFWGF
jgi:hypothetical protein